MVHNTIKTIAEARIRSIKVEDKEDAFNSVALSETLLVNGVFASLYTGIFG